jgi:L-cysteate sulfo-lyase
MPPIPTRPPLPRLPRVALLDGPTPLHPLPRLSEALGGRAELWIKREDLGPLAFSGNKLRNLEFLLGSAVAAGADTVITSGRRWSNHCRLTAAAGARLGLEVHIVINGPHVDGSANVRLMRELGATIHEGATDARSEREALVERVAARAIDAGRRARVLPVGGSDPAGAWGQVLAALEAFDQARAAGFTPDAIVLPTATGGTQAGLTLGAAIEAAASEAADGTAGVAGAASPEAVARILGIAVHPDPELLPKIRQLVASLADLAGIEPAPLEVIELDERHVGPGYGLAGDESVAATALLARTEGILVDPVYGAKGLAGLVEHVRSGSLDGQRVVFWHGGGLPALFEPELGR